MTRWKMVPVEPTPEMLTALYLDSDEHGFARADYALMLAAAPDWKPSEEDVERAIAAFYAHGVQEMRTATRAAILAAVGGHDEH